MDITNPEFEEHLIQLGRPGAPRDPMRTPKLTSAPHLAALLKTGTSHVYADTADVDELAELLAAGGGTLLAEVDGNTANQPLVARVVDRYLEAPSGWAARLARQLDGAQCDERRAVAYAALCARIGNDVVRRFATGRDWQPSLQLHMQLCHDPDAARATARLLQRMAPAAFVKVPFAPYAPDCLLVARDLEREGICVNFTSTFSARQVVAAAALANVSRTNIFMGRLSQGLQTDGLGEHVCLRAQRALRRLRRERSVSRTQLIAASIRDWRSLALAAGTDVFTAPCPVLLEFLKQDELAPEDLVSRVDGEVPDEELPVPRRVEEALGRERIEVLWRVGSEFQHFVREYGATREYRELRDGERLVRRFEEAGFGDFFHTPDEPEWRDIRKGKLPDLDAPVTARVALDTLYSLLADADFEKHQAEIDRKLDGALG